MEAVMQSLMEAFEEAVCRDPGPAPAAKKTVTVGGYVSIEAVASQIREVFRDEPVSLQDAVVALAKARKQYVRSSSSRLSQAHKLNMGAALERALEILREAVLSDHNTC
jgi:hypothetical protein